MANLPFPRRTLPLLLAAPLLLGGAGTVFAAPPAAIEQPGTVLTVNQDNLWNLAGRIGYATGSSRQQVMVAILRRNPDAFVQGNMHRLRSGVELQLPSAQDIAAESPARSEALVGSQLQALESGTASPRLPDRIKLQAAGTGAAASAPSAASSAAAGSSADSAASAGRTTVPPAGSQPGVPLSAASADAPAATPPRPSPAPRTDEGSRPPSAASTAETPAAAKELPRSTEPSSPVVPGSGPGWNQLLPIALLLLLGGGSWWAWSRRQRRADFEEAVISSFFDENGVRRPSRPKLIDVSQAAMEMARTVETLTPAGELVRSGQSVTAQLPAAGDAHDQAAIKLEIARASLEVNRIDAARSMLQAVQREGNSGQQLAAGELLARLLPPTPPSTDTAAAPA